MYKHILIATDGSALADRGLSHGLELARSLGVPVTVVTVTETWTAIDLAGDVDRGVTDPIGTFEKATKAAAERVLLRAAEAAKDRGVSAETLHVADKHPAEGIIAAASETGSDLIVMASHGRRGLGRLLLGSQATQVLTHSTVPVLIVR